MKQLNCRSATQLFRCKTNTHGSDPYQRKSKDPFGPPSNYYTLHAHYSYALKGGSRFTHQDRYILRLTETYFLKAGAYGGLGNAASTATDINLLRARSNAAPVIAGNVNIDYILDERIREPGIEEKIMFANMRLGDCYDMRAKQAL